MRIKTLLSITVSFILVIPLSGVDVVTVDGKNLKGSRLHVQKGILSVGKEELPLEEVIRCRWGRDHAFSLSRGEYMVYLSNGDRIGGSVIHADEDEGDLIIQSHSFGRIKLEKKYISCIRFSDQRKKQHPSTSYDAGRTKDTLVFVNGDSLDGAVKRISTTGIIFESVVGKMHYKYSDLSYIYFHHSAANSVSGDTFFRVVTIRGEFISGKEIVHRDDVVIINSFLAGKITLPEKVLSLLKVVNGRFVYISDITPFRVEERSFWKEGYIWHYHLDRSIDGNSLRLNGTEYIKGIGVHSYCRLIYRLETKYETFVSKVGIDDEVTEYGNVDIIIVGDGATLFKKQGVAVHTKPIHVSVDVSSVDVLELIVDFGKAFDIGDHVDWAEAYLIRKKKTEEPERKDR